MVWKSIACTFCLLEPWPSDQSKCTNIFHYKTQFLPKESKHVILHLLDNFHNILTFYRKKYTVNSQLNYRIVKYSE